MKTFIVATIGLICFLDIGKFSVQAASPAGQPASADPPGDYFQKAALFYHPSKAEQVVVNCINGLGGRAFLDPVTKEDLEGVIKDYSLKLVNIAGYNASRSDEIRDCIEGAHLSSNEPFFDPEEKTCLENIVRGEADKVKADIDAIEDAIKALNVKLRELFGSADTDVVEGLKCLNKVGPDQIDYKYFSSGLPGCATSELDTNEKKKKFDQANRYIYLEELSLEDYFKNLGSVRTCISGNNNGNFRKIAVNSHIMGFFTNVEKKCMKKATTDDLKFIRNVVARYRRAIKSVAKNAPRRWTTTDQAKANRLANCH